MRVAMIGLTYPFRGGIAHYATSLFKALAERSDAEFFTLRRQYPSLLFPGETQYDRGDDDWGAPHQPCLDSLNPLSWLATARGIRRFQPDVAVIHWWHPFFGPAFGTVARLLRRRGVPVCLLCHNAKPHEGSKLDAVLSSFAFRAADAFIAHSEADAKELRRRRPDAPVLQAPHPIYDWLSESAIPSDEAKRKLGLEDRTVLLFFGFVRKYKGLRPLLEAMTRFEKDKNVQLLIVGEFYDKRQSYEPRLGELIKHGSVTLVDRYVPNEEVPLYFSAADLVTLPYLTATQSGVANLAFGFRKPVLSTTVGGLPELIRDGETGYLVPPNDPAAIAAAVRRFIAEPNCDKFKTNIERVVRENSWDNMVDVIEEVTRSLS